MTYVNNVIAKPHNLTDKQHATRLANAERVIEKGARRNAAYKDAMRLRNAIATFEAIRPAEAELITASGLGWDRTVKERRTFRGFHGDRLEARVTRAKPPKFIVTVESNTLPGTFTTLSTARAAVATALAAWRTQPKPLS